MTDTTKEEEEQNQGSHFVSEGMMGSTPDNYEDVEEVEPQPPVTQAERDAINSRGVVQPSIESQLAAEKEYDAKPQSGEELQELADEQKDKVKVVSNPPRSLQPNLDPDVVVVPSDNGGGGSEPVPEQKSNAKKTTSSGSSTNK